MRKLSLPACGSMELFDQCVAEVDDPPARNHLLGNRANVEAAAQDFDNVAALRAWCNLPRAAHGQANAIISGTITKSQLMSLYSKNIVKSKGAARQTYDDLLVSANGKCPYCGGIGDPKTLDHYLPKARFPLYSILPKNLVPCCRDCNSEMRAAFPTVTNEQIIHPYLDDDHFFTEKWTTAVVMRTDPITVRFSVSAPNHWAPVDRDRVSYHFEDCDLAFRYSKQVSGEIGPLIDQRKASLRNLPVADFRAFLSDIAESNTLPINGWRRTLYAALANTNWFYSADFNSPHGHMP